MTLAVLAGALAFDLFVGEPPNPLHPVVWMGTLQRWLRRRARSRLKSPAGQLLYGVMMALVGPALFGGGASLLLRAVGGVAAIVMGVFLLKSSFAARGLGAAGLAVARALAAGDLSAAREALRSLVSRDTSELGPPLLAAAAIESVAENISDSVVAPLFYFCLGGVPAALAYRACNTLDAMIGYHGETEWLGKAAARLDDLLNLIPARITALLVVLASPLCGASAAGALRIWRRDGGRTESPNAGRPMAAMAGALALQLEKVGCYRLGDATRAPAAGDIRRAVAIMAVAMAGAFAAAAIFAAVQHGG
jgi:adenosylcobinamide-phosphate synthase